MASCLMLVAVPDESFAAEPLQFNRDIRPILSANCFACHGFDAKTRQAELRLDTSEGAAAEHEGRVAIKPGDLTASEVWQRITSTDPDQVMPPPASKKSLTDEQKATLKQWIEEGAKYQRHWSFEAPVAAPEPVVQNAAWSKHPVDRFLAARLEREGLPPNAEADRPTLIRRAAFSLTGLPPTREEVQTFLADQSPEAYERMLQRYLDSPHFGEEFGRHWLDVARYADTHGLHLDNEREMWAYRDWVVRAFNRNQSFDQFTRDQLAGDLQPEPTQDQLIATGFNRCNVSTSEGGSIEPEFLYRYAVDRTSTMVQAWMGLTGGCAVCHDHKFDPLSTREFYSLYAFFYSAADPAMDKNIRNTDPFMKLPTPDQAAALKQLQTEEQTRLEALEALAAQATYVDPAAQEPPAAAVPVNDLWLDDVPPFGAKVTSKSRNAPTWSTERDLPIPSGQRALRQASAVLYEDKFENPAASWVIPENAKLAWMVRLDPSSPSETIQVELQTSQGVRRVLWGNVERIGSGEVGKPERLHRGPLPASGEWVSVEISAADWNLAAGTVVNGLHLSQYGGVVWWDAFLVTGELSPAKDPSASLTEWWRSRTKQDMNGAPDALKPIIKQGPEKTTDEAQKTELQKFYLARIARPVTPELQASRAAWHMAQVARITLEDSLPGTFVFRDMNQPREAFVMLRGQYDKPGERVEPTVPAFLPALQRKDASLRPNRSDLAEWLLAPEHPLTARVAVNRIWQQLFGTGLVKTSDDFGTQGEPPSHPELLDWLAVWYREHGWDTKALAKLLMTSAAFRQDARITPESLTKDPHNRLYARGPRFRLDAEQIRDNALYVGGIINLDMGGPGARPYQPPNIWEPVGYADSNTRYYLQEHGANLYRRSIYCFLKRTAPPPFMSNFDGPNREQLCARRERSNTPLQALQLLNDVQHVEAARGLAQRMLRDGGSTSEDRLRYGFQLVLSRTPDADELRLVKSALERFTIRYQNDAESARRLIHTGESQPDATLPVVDLAAYTLAANLLLNLDETVTRN